MKPKPESATATLRAIFVCFVLLALVPAPRAARAAESYDNCTGFIDALPATISTQGVWCLRHDLATNIASGNAITILTNNVTIDCNDFKVGGLAAGNDSLAHGIDASNRQNATIRHCNIRGFYYGIYILGGNAGHLVEDNRLDNNLYTGIFLDGFHNLVQRNRVFDTGGATGQSFAYGIDAYANVLDNIVDGVFATPAGTSPVGIRTRGDDNVVRGNYVGGSVSGNTGAIGIDVWGDFSVIDGNRVLSSSTTGDRGILSRNANTICINNVVTNYLTAYQNCLINSNNQSISP